MVPLLLLDDTGRPPGDPTVLDELLRSLGGGPPRIRCPLCAWRPLRSSRWLCNRPG